MDGFPQRIRIGTNTAKNLTFGPDSPAGDTDLGGERSASLTTTEYAPPDRSVFVVHGRDNQLKEAIFMFLRALDLAPLEWGALVAATGKAAPFVGDVVQRAPTLARAAVVLLSPDDIVYLHPELILDDDQLFETRPAGQPRPNVLIELGMVLATYPDRTVIVQAGGLRPIGDLAGRHVVRLDGSTGPLNRIKQRLLDAGCAADTSGDEWLRVDSFASLRAYHRGTA